MAGREYEVGGTVYEFPDSFDDAKVKDILVKKGVIKAHRHGASDSWSTGLQRFSRALSEANPLSMEHGTPEELARRASRPLSEQLAPFNPVNIARGIAQPFQELSRGEVAEGTGHLVGALGTGGPKPQVKLQSPVTLGPPRLPELPAVVKRYLPGHEAINIATDASRLRLRSPLTSTKPVVQTIEKRPAPPRAPFGSVKPNPKPWERPVPTRIPERQVPPRPAAEPDPGSIKPRTAGWSQAQTPRTAPAPTEALTEVDLTDVPEQYRGGVVETAKKIAKSREAKVTKIADLLRKTGLTPEEQAAKDPATLRKLVAKRAGYNDMSETTWEHLMREIRSGPVRTEPLPSSRFERP